MLKLDTTKGRADIVNAAMTEVGSKIREVGKTAGARVEQRHQRVAVRCEARDHVERRDGAGGNRYGECGMRHERVVMAVSVQVR